MTRWLLLAAAAAATVVALAAAAGWLVRDADLCLCDWEA